MHLILKVLLNVFRYDTVYFMNFFPNNYFFCLKVAPSFRSMVAVQQEQSSATLCELHGEGSRKSCEVSSPEEKKEQLKWSRLPGQVKCFIFLFK